MPANAFDTDDLDTARLSRMNAEAVVRRWERRRRAVEEVQRNPDWRAAVQDARRDVGRLAKLLGVNVGKIVAEEAEGSAAEESAAEE
jgi:hypothetical protein